MSGVLAATSVFDLDEVSAVVGRSGGASFCGFRSGLSAALEAFFGLKASRILPTGDGERLDEERGGKRVPVLLRLRGEDSESTDSERRVGKVDALFEVSDANVSRLTCSSWCSACTIGDDVVN